MKANEIQAFQSLIYRYFAEAGRQFPWRETGDPYRIWISEIMLQQTQTARVVPKYMAFLERFPTVRTLAEAPLADLLGLWQGLGYNRRALAMQKAAQQVVTDWNGQLPTDLKDLQTLPGIGSYTASAIAAFAYNYPSALIETNIRRAYIHYFFSDAASVDDRQLLPLIAETLDAEQPRIWYYALMDYGASLGKAQENPNRRSKQYVRQSAFVGSNRQVRGAIVKALLGQKRLNIPELATATGLDPERIEKSLPQLTEEGFLVAEEQGFYGLAS